MWFRKSNNCLFCESSHLHKYSGENTELRINKIWLGTEILSSYQYEYNCVGSTRRPLHRHQCLLCIIIYFIKPVVL
jgi:hypothetical protein